MIFLIYIGSRFALMELKAIVYSLLLKFEIIPNEKTQIPIRIAKIPFGARPEKGVHVQLKLRKQN